MLHHLEFVALTVCWMTFWGGLLFFLGHEKNGTIHRYVLETCSVLLVIANVTMLIVSGYLFGREYRRDKKKAKIRRATKREQLNYKEKKMMSSIKKKLTLGINNSGLHRTQSTVSTAHAIHRNFSLHEAGFNKKTEERQERAKRKTQLRLKARVRLKDSKALHELNIFSALEEAEINLIIDQMDHIVRYKGDVLCHQHDVSDAFYVIVKGSAAVTVDIVKKAGKEGAVKTKTKAEAMEQGDVHDPESRPEQLQVAEIETLGFFGEPALLIVTENGVEKPSYRSATVYVKTDKCDLLRLKRSAFKKILEIDDGHVFKDKHLDNKSVLGQLKDTQIERVKTNTMLLEQNRSSMLGGGSEGRNLTTIVPILDEVGVLGPPKGVPNLVKLNGGVNIKNERSLYS